MKRKIFSILLALMLVSGLSLAIAVPAGANGVPSHMVMSTGSYTGDGVDDRLITGVGFQPDVVFIKGDLGRPGILRTSTMVGDVSKSTGSGAAPFANRIQSLDAGGFTIGSDVDVNKLEAPTPVTYYWVAFKADASEMKVGTYTGDGVDGRDITGVGFQPDYVIVIPDNGYAPVQATSSLAGKSWNFIGDSYTNAITAMLADGFNVGNNLRTNEDETAYHYIAWKTVSGRMDVGSYTGNGSDDRSITGVGFQPEWVITQRATGGNAQHKPASLDTGYSQVFSGDANVTNRIQALENDGFQVGSADIVNNNGVTYYYMAFSMSYDLIVASTAGGSVTEPGEGTFTYDAGTEVDLLAVPATDYRFVNWTGNVGTIDDTNAADTFITMNNDYLITANFAIKPSVVYVDNDWEDQDDVSAFNPALTWQVDAFALIGDGVDAVASGGTVHVLAGTYNETNIEIIKTLTVQSVSGDWHDTTLNVTGVAGFMLEPSGGGPDQFHENFTISGLTIEGGYFGIDIDGLADGNTVNISNCHIYEAALVGIFGSDMLDGDIFIDGCVIGENGWDTGSGGIQLATITGTLQITDSFIGGYWDGTEDYSPNSSNGMVLESIAATASVLIDNNIIAGNGGYGIYCPTPTVNGELTITDNIIGAYDFDPTEEDACFTGNDDWGILIEHVTLDSIVTIEDNKLAENGSGIRIEANYGESTISNNYVGAWTQGTTTHDGNDSSGVIVDQTPAGSLLIQDNNISKNDYTGLHVANNDAGAGAVTIDGNTLDDNGTGGYGNYLSNVDHATISNNTITLHTSEGSPYSGIYLASSSYNTISGNTINENDFGIYIDSNSYYNEVLNNTIQDNNIDGIFIKGDNNYILGNDISNNQGMVLCGVYLTDTAEDNVINYNNITGNTAGFSVGVYNERTVDVDAENNWWGDASGPSGEGPGSGDAVSEYVDYDPWLGQEWSGEVWVDDDYSPATPGWGVTHFDDIQDAIDAVFPGTTINVAAGEYEIGEPALEDGEDDEDFSDYDYLADIWIYKDGLTLQAENLAAGLEDPMDPDEASIIYASGDAADVVNIAADNVTFDGFTVDGEDEAGCGVDIYDWWEDEWYSDCAVTNNYITDNDYGGVWLEGDGHNISYNIITDNNYGIDIGGIAGSSVIIEDNEISDADTLIYLEDVVDGSSVTISNNTLYYCGCAIYCGDDTLDGSSVVIENNEIYEADCGIGFGHVTGGSELTIQNNEIYDCGDGIDLDLVDEESTVTIADNEIYDCEYDGIYLGNVSDESTITIQNNNIYENDDEGIDIDEVSGDSTVAIVGNTITDNHPGGGGGETGIYLGDGVNVSGVRVNFNNIVDNGDYGVVYEHINAVSLNARNNWWGSANGPGEDGANDVSDNVNYDPWLIVPVIGGRSATVGAGGTLDASSEAGVSVGVTGGSATVTAVKYDGNPTTGSFSGGTGQYIDIQLADVVGVTEIEIRLYYTDAQVAAAGVLESSLSLKWWDGDSWEEITPSGNSGVNTTDIAAPPPAGAPYSGYMWARINNTSSSPSLSELLGTPFGGSGGTPGGGGGGTARTVGTLLPPDTTAPLISNVMHEVTHNAANIYWTTDKLGTSQVEYWASPSTLSPLDTSLVMSHLVHLTGLTPTTTYHYKVMSKDSDGNLAVSDEYTFTTLETPTAAFTASNLSISPAEVNSGGLVTITLSVANTGGAGGSYNVVLKINGVKEAEQSITLATGESQDVSFSVARAEAGSYSVEVNGLTGSFTVAAAAAAPIAWWIWVIAGVVVVGLIIFFVARRRAY